jgi:hypothetical protein
MFTRNHIRTCPFEATEAFGDTVSMFNAIAVVNGHDMPTLLTPNEPLHQKLDEKMTSIGNAKGARDQRPTSASTRLRIPILASLARRYLASSIPWTLLLEAFNCCVRPLPDHMLPGQHSQNIRLHDHDSHPREVLTDTRSR